MAWRLDLKYFARHVLVPWTIAAALATGVFQLASSAPWATPSGETPQIITANVDK